jgi:hypothetical protein
MEVYQQAENIVTRQVAGETLLVPISGDLADLGQIFSLNEVGRFIWERLAREGDVEGLVGAIVQEFDVTREKAFLDVSELLRDLLQARLIARQ